MGRRDIHAREAIASCLFSRCSFFALAVHASVYFWTIDVEILGAGVTVRDTDGDGARAGGIGDGGANARRVEAKNSGFRMADPGRVCAKGGAAHVQALHA